MSTTPERLSRRKLLIGAAGAGLVAATGGLARTRETRSSPPENLSFPIGLEITDSDWGSIIQRAEESRNCIYSVRPTIYSGLPLWKFKLSIIDQEKADSIPVGESDWQYVPSNIKKLKYEQAWTALISYTAAAIVTFPDKTDEIRSLMDGSRKEILEMVHNPAEDYYLTTNFPENGFYLENILGERVDVPKKKWNEFTTNMNEAFNPKTEWRETHQDRPFDYERYIAFYDRFVKNCAWIKHFAPAKLPDYYFYYPDSFVRPGSRDAISVKAYEYRKATNCDGTIIGDWWRFTELALTARMLELDTIKMTAQGLVLS
ncbi:MAG: hypothetical protein HYT11_03190 [Candidatus Levybacteria bacterium]|nr:hypothetical protein [Candidatus Levybacteria bacterium]